MAVEFFLMDMECFNSCGFFSAAMAVPMAMFFFCCFVTVIELL